MLFGSFTFLFGFLPVTWLVYQALSRPESQFYAKVFLVLASLVFYGWWDVRYVPLILLSVFTNYGLSLLIQARPTRARAVFICGLVFNLGLLGYFKYANFVSLNVSDLLGLHVTLKKVILPLAISFFTFQQIAYLVEVYKDKKAADSFLDYSLFVLFFSHLIAGPITHHKEMLPQFKVSGRAPTPANYMNVGLAILVLGLCKKAVIADTLAGFCNPVFIAADGGASVSTQSAWMGALGYTLQLYFDFSAYSDMAIGLGLMFSIRLPVNFASPYKSTSIIEFWRRWHISLSRFLRNYLYIPLGGNRRGAAMRYVNLMITMALGGLWHGAGWTFLAWGLLHGAYLVVNHLWRSAFGPARGRAALLAGWCLTSLAVVVGWVMFRATTFEGAERVLQGMFNPAYAHLNDGFRISALQWFAVAVAGLITVASPNVLELAGYPDSTPGLPIEADGIKPLHWAAPAFATAAVLGVVAAFAIAKLPNPGVFLYFNF